MCIICAPCGLSCSGKHLPISSLFSSLHLQLFIAAVDGSGGYIEQSMPNIKSSHLSPIRCSV